ncbi:MAG: transposase, partial [Mycolicibacterium frederiksbergense]|nr:transposase [Mycolicibacterium frederiksbergense]
EALEFGRKLASRRHRFVDHRLALEELLTRWEVGSASSAAERRIAINMAREDRLHLSAEGTKSSAAQAVADLPSVTKPPRRSHDSDLLNEVRKDEAGDDDTEEELDDDFGGDDDDFYRGSFEDA